MTWIFPEGDQAMQMSELEKNEIISVETEEEQIASVSNNGLTHDDKLRQIIQFLWRKGHVARHSQKALFDFAYENLNEMDKILRYFGVRVDYNADAQEIYLCAVDGPSLLSRTPYTRSRSVLIILLANRLWQHKSVVDLVTINKSDVFEEYKLYMLNSADLNKVENNFKLAWAFCENSDFIVPSPDNEEVYIISQYLKCRVTANDLAVMMNVPVNKIIGTCMSLGLFVSINQRLDAETINLVAEEFGFQTEYVAAHVVEEINADEVVNDEDIESRCPIVTVMGHVDHGKTSLLDHIRNANVIAGEAGGITQHIGAYNVKLKNGQHITFLDTPGHAAFTAMRARGAKVTDIAIIIIAADDAVMPQTIEAINHAQAAGVPMVFAINKVDKPGANPDKIREQLSNMNILVEDWGGKYQCQEISAKKGTGVYELLEKVLLEAEMLDLKANPKRRAKGSVIESSLDKGRGYVATLLVQDGTLHMGDIVLAGTFHGRIKAMFNERGQKITEVRPGEPCSILGLNGAPQAGDEFNVLPTEQEAREIANKREQLQREQSIRTKKHIGLEEIGRRLAIGDFKELNIIVKADVDGSVEAIKDSLIKLSTENIQVNVIHGAVGAISDSDVMLAAASDALIVGFNVRPTGTARKMAEQEEVDIRIYSIIYDAINEIKDAMAGMLAPEVKEEVTATLEVLQTFHISKVGTIAGCIVREGKIKRGNKVRVIRDGIVIKTAELASLKHVKDDIKEAGVNTECGVSLKAYDDLQPGDMLESFEEIEVAKTL